MILNAERKQPLELIDSLSSFRTLKNIKNPSFIARVRPGKHIFQKRNQNIHYRVRSITLERWQNTYTSILAIILVLFIYFIARRKFHRDFYKLEWIKYHILGQVVCVGRFKMGLSH